jgi:Tol biopolymer transport system component
VTDPKSIQSPANPRAHPVPIEDLFFTRSVSSGSWSPNGKEIAFTTNLTGRANLWKVSAAGGWPEQLAQSDERQTGAAWSADGKWIAFQQDYGGNELWDVMAVPSEGGAVVNLTNTPEVREESPRWSPDGKSLAINLKPKAGTSYNVALLDWATHKISPLTHETGTDRSWESVAWSPDGRTLYANRTEVGGNTATCMRSRSPAHRHQPDAASGRRTVRARTCHRMRNCCCHPTRRAGRATWPCWRSAATSAPGSPTHCGRQPAGGFPRRVLHSRTS